MRAEAGATAMIVGLLFLGAAVTAAEPAMLEMERDSQCGRWHVAIYASGFAHVVSRDTCGGRGEGATLRRIMPADLIRVRKALRDADFATMPSRLTPPTVVTDEDVLTISSRVSGETGEVMAFGVERLENKETGRRFELVWDTVVALAVESK